MMIPLEIPATRNGRALKNPWAGGLNLPQFSPVDLNNDGIQDLVAFDRYGQVSATFINRGTPGQVDYEHAPSYMPYFPQLEGRNFMLFRDYNCDGIADAFGMYESFGRGFGVAVWQGSYHQDTLHFTRIIDELTYDASAQGLSRVSKLFIYNTDLPAIDDADGDGDLDILGFTLDICFPTNVFYYKNESVERGYGCDSLHFVLESECWGLFSESGDSSKVDMGPSTDSCYNNQWFNALPPMRPNRGQTGVLGSARHVGASTTIIDYNGDNSMDMAMGGVTFTNVNMVDGVTINDTVLITNQDYLYPSYDKPAHVYSFPSTFFLDVNNDGKKDFLVAPSEMGFGEAVMDSVAWYYENTGSNSNMIFNYRQKDFLVGDMIDVGERSYPVLFDHNADGLLDLVVGGIGRVQQDGSFKYGLSLLINTGTNANPSYDWVTDDYANAALTQAHGLYPTMGDLDGDGDLDMICGARDGTLWFFKNNGGPNRPAVWGAPQANYFGINVGSNSTPQLFDLDKDGLLDLVIGCFAGNIFYFENIGMPNAPSFSSTPTSNNLSGYNVAQSFSRNSMPYFYDNGGNFELFIGHREGGIVHLGNINNNLLGTYDTLSEQYNDIYYGWYSKPAGLVDINGNGKLEFLIGTGNGGLMFLHKPERQINVDVLPTTPQVAFLYPNPAKEQLTIGLEAPPTAPVQVTFYNALGQPLMQRTLQDQKEQLNIRALPSGVLFVTFEFEQYRETRQFIKQ